MPLSRPLRWAAISVLVVVLLLIAAILLRDRIVRLLVAWLGPPPVTMREVYETRPGGPVFDHSIFDDLLEWNVDEAGRVDYVSLGEEAHLLDGYIGALASAPLDEMGRDERLALLINAYNAFTLRLILDHYPIGSIKDIPASARWNDVRWSLGDRRWSLDQIENELIRPNFVEPRIHFSLVCAANGCPPLRDEAYTAAELEGQLADQTRRVHEGERWFRYDAAGGVVSLTPLYLWYAGDFEQAAGSVPEYAARHSGRLHEAMDDGRRPRIEWLDYDWSLNEVSP